MEVDKNEETAKNSAIKNAVTDGTKELTFRTGEAEKIIYPNKVTLSGVINTPANFYMKRKALHNKDKCHVVYDKQVGTIKLVVDEQNNTQNYEVTGAILPNPQLAPFKINSGSTTTIKDLMQILKFNRVFFADKDDNAKIVLALQNFKAKVEQTLEDSNDNRGAQGKVKISKLEHELQESFVLNMAIFKGSEPTSFKVDVCVQLTDAGSPVVWLESRDLKDMQVNGIDGMITAELDAFKDIVCVEV
jgi:regulatory protein YycH of two-component signal transduction system YycFG